MTIRTGLNINCEAPGPDRQAAADFACDLNATGHLLLDDFKSKYWFAWQLYSRSPNSVRVHRRYMPKDVKTGWDGSLQEARNGDSPTGYLLGKQFAQFLKQTQAENGAPPGTLEQVYNEPDYHGDLLRFKNNWLIECMDEAARLNLALCVDNAQERSIWQSEVDAGYYDGLLSKLAQYPQMRLGVHSYGLGVLQGNISNAAIGKLATPGAFPYSSWKVETEAEFAAQRSAYLANWKESHLCSGSKALVERAKFLKLPPPKIIKTEAGWDNVALGKDGVIRAGVQALNNGRLPMGYPTLEVYWQKMFQAERWTKSQAAFEQLKWWDKVEIPEVEALCIYTLDTSFEDGNYHVA